MFKINAIKTNIFGCMFLTLLVYLFLYSIFLYKTDGLPYVFDNNETYSSLVHAYNMYFGDWKVHFGLTDEAFSPDPAAHPIIHTHQGNWPRILAFILFALGARSAESQITIHVFTIGLASIYLMYRFFEKAANSYFSMIASLILMTDYVLFMQWQVVTYRVWHVFFLFSSLICIHNFEKSIKHKIFFVLNFVALYYWELVFAFYVSCWALLYYAHINGYNFKKVFRLGIILSISGLISLSVLLYQLSLYMGFKNTILDFYYTFIARNIASSPEIIAKIQSFYSNLDVAFWNNIVDGKQYKSFSQFIRIFFSNGFQIHTPIITLQILIIFSNMFLLHFQEFLKKIVFLNKTISYAHVKKIFFCCFFITSSILLYDNKFMGISLDNHEYYKNNFLSVICSPAIAYYLTRLLELFIAEKQKIYFFNIFSIIAFTIICNLIIVYGPEVYQQNNSIIWHKYLSTNIPENVWMTITLSVFFLMLVNFFIKKNSLLNIINYYYIYGFLLAGFLSYVITYQLSPGYVISGYLSRCAPFVVFLIDILIAIAIWFLIDTIALQYKISKNYFSTIKFVNLKYFNTIKLSFVIRIIIFSGSIIIVLILLNQWLHNQIFYNKIFPADSLSFIKILRQENFKGKSIITNNYPLPFAYETQSWAYNGTEYGAGELEMSPQGYINKHNIEYFWYKNKNNPAYRTPDFYVCFSPDTIEEVKNRLKNYATKTNRCSSNRVISHAKLYDNDLNNGLFLKHTLINYDTSSKDKWAIVKMDWDYPPYLIKNSETNKYFTTVINKKNNSILVRYQYSQQKGLSENFTKIKIVKKNPKNLEKILWEGSAKNGQIEIKLKFSLTKDLVIIGVPYTQTKIGANFEELIDLID